MCSQQDDRAGNEDCFKASVHLHFLLPFVVPFFLLIDANEWGLITNTLSV